MLTQSNSKGIQDHGALSGLIDDDHLQYILVSGSRTFTGNQDLGGFNLIDVGDIALDTISSALNTTVTVNLGADSGDDFIVGNNNTLVVEGDTDRVGIGTNSPQGKLDVQDGSDGRIYLNESMFRFRTKALLGYSRIDIIPDATQISFGFNVMLINRFGDIKLDVLLDLYCVGLGWGVFEAYAGDGLFLSTGGGNQPIVFGVNRLEVMRLDGNGNLLLGTTSVGTSGVGVLGIANGTIPSSSPANMVQLYAEDVSSSSELRVRDESGTVTTLSPHPQHILDLLPVDDDHQLPFVYRSHNDYIGKEIIIDLELLARTVEQLTGKRLIRMNDIPKKDWAINQERLLVKRDKELKAIQLTIDKLDIQLLAELTEVERKELVKQKELAISQLPKRYYKKTIPKWIDDRIKYNEGF